MNGATTIQERLKDLRLNKGLKLEELAEQTGISKSALGSYEKDDYKEINHGNLILLADFYGVSLDYLFCRTENRAEINTPLRELHLSDEMVALLKSGRINNRLLCELATHKDFIKFLADIEIYVDGIATMQIHNLNALVDTVRHEIIERYRPGEDDPHLKVLQAAHISDDEYFSHMVRDDLNLIIRDIREAHKKDSESAPQTTVANELKENLEAVENFKGSRDEKLVVLYCKQLGINYKNLSDEEFRWLIRILKKSKENVYYYITTLNENYHMPAMPAGVEEGIRKGIYKLESLEGAKGKVQLLGSGSILRHVREAAQILSTEYGIGSDVYSVTSFTELARDGQDCERWNMLHPSEAPRVPYIAQIMNDAPAVASTDYMKLFAEQVRTYVPADDYRVLGTDGFGRSDSRENLRHHFEVDTSYVIVAALGELAKRGEIDVKVVEEAINKYNINPEKVNPRLA